MKAQGNVVLRLKIMMALEFAMWGAYLTSMSNYLGRAGMGGLIAWFFAIQGLVCLVMPALAGIVADRWMQPRKLLGLCVLGSGAMMTWLWWMGYVSEKPDALLFTTAYTIGTALYMPTVALCNSLAFKVLRGRGMDGGEYFPRIRVWGTIGFVVAMWFVNCAYVADGGGIGLSFEGTNRFQFTCWQFLTSGVLSLMLFLFTFVLDDVPVGTADENKGENASLSQRLGLNALGVFRKGNLLVFMVLSMLVYGIAFDFFNIAGAIFIERSTDRSVTASAQGLFMMMTNGVGASIGTVAAGYVVDSLCHWESTGAGAMSFLVGDWPVAWGVFALFALVNAVLFGLLFKSSKKKNRVGLLISCRATYNSIRAMCVGML